jgi:hypothetical protein
MVRIAMLVVMMVATANVQVSAQENDWHAIIGSGVKSCGVWTEVRQTRHPQQGMYTQWVAGYLSGLNEGRSEGSCIQRQARQSSNGL